MHHHRYFYSWLLATYKKMILLIPISALSLAAQEPDRQIEPLNEAEQHMADVVAKKRAREQAYLESAQLEQQAIDRAKDRAERQPIFEKTWRMSYDVPMANIARSVPVDAVPPALVGRYCMILHTEEKDTIGPEIMVMLRNNVTSRRHGHAIIHQVIRHEREDGKLVAYEMALSDKRSLFVRIVTDVVFALTDAENERTEAIVIVQLPENDR